MFWELVDEMLNAVLFVLMGLEVLLIEFNWLLLGAGAMATAVALLSRGVTAGLPIRMFRTLFQLPVGSARVLTWGGLRGGISVALALSLPPSDHRDVIVALTYCVVVFSVLVQGTTVGAVASRVLRPDGRGRAGSRAP
jgi:CPA1 family monovalent cation:H+ antiporter